MSKVLNDRSAKAAIAFETPIVVVTVTKSGDQGTVHFGEGSSTRIGDVLYPAWVVEQLKARLAVLENIATNVAQSEPELQVA